MAILCRFIAELNSNYIRSVQMLRFEDIIWHRPHCSSSMLIQLFSCIAESPLALSEIIGLVFCRLFSFKLRHPQEWALVAVVSVPFINYELYKYSCYKSRLLQSRSFLFSQQFAPILLYLNLVFQVNVLQNCGVRFTFLIVLFHPT